ncbi:hypothetical protein C7H19_20025 [Aphanothece hegewaldii CCALA 016]|uniref:Uncharacterized protein n=1 Tax=Aphanothece hegewaldii CCALA 016 TaxID=2107694 RepID=A0A2T1LT38_9CHRO|nr:hypothetical protein [Aphanothece hegewaldii]PSF33460.1 hypothetical protein C7H19_20025 [Aphanothece hegewaldii CCALA 016]
MNGFAAESLFLEIIKAIPKIKTFAIPDSQTLINIANTHKIGRKRLELAYPYLLQEWGEEIRHPKTGQLTLKLIWANIPASVILDYIFGIDCCITFLGYAVAIDISCNQKAIEEKVIKLCQLRPLWQAIGMDNACVCHITNKNLNKDSVWSALKTVSKQNQVIPVTL